MRVSVLLLSLVVACFCPCFAGDAQFAPAAPSPQEAVPNTEIHIQADDIQPNEVVTNAHESVAIDFFGMVKHRLHVMIHGCPCDPKPLKIKAKALPPPPLYKTIQVQVKDPPAPPTFHVEEHQVLVPQPKRKDRAIPQPPCVAPISN